MRSYSLTTKSSTLDLTSTTAAQKLVLSSGDPEAATSSPQMASQVASVFITSNQSNTAATVTFVLFDGGTGKKRGEFQYTVTATAYRDPIAGGASGNYICTVVGADGTNKIDLNGWSQPVITSSTGAINASGSCDWYVVYETDTGTTASLDVCVAPTRAI